MFSLKKVNGGGGGGVLIRFGEVGKNRKSNKRGRGWGEDWGGGGVY